MQVYVNGNNEIKDVNTTTDETLVAVEIPDEVFANRTVAEICCYRLNLRGGQYTGFTPYVDSIVIEQIKRLANQNIALEEQNAMLLDCVMEMSEIIYA